MCCLKGLESGGGRSAISVFFRNGLGVIVVKWVEKQEVVLVDRTTFLL